VTPDRRAAGSGRRFERTASATGSMRRPWAGPVLAWALAALLLTTGTWHFAAPSGFESIVPRFLGSAAFWVRVSGVAELAGAVLLTLPRTRRVGGWAVAVLFVLVFPANITMAVRSLQGHGSVLVAWLRLPLQIPLVLWAVFVARHAHRTDERPVRPSPHGRGSGRGRPGGLSG
jgi:uncharacterized membrane protein